MYVYRDRVTDFLMGIISFTFGLIITGLVLRLLFRLLGANPSAGFTRFLYDSTAPLLTPFNGIFAPYVVERGYVFEFSTLIAIVVYGFISWLLIELISYMYSNTPEYTKVKEVRRA